MKRGTLKLKSLRSSNTASFIQEPVTNTQIQRLKVFILINNNIINYYYFRMQYYPMRCIILEPVLIYQPMMVMILITM